MATEPIETREEPWLPGLTYSADNRPPFDGRSKHRWDDRPSAVAWNEALKDEPETRDDHA